MSDNLQGTGRTTRMLQEAKKLIHEGKTVCIVGANERHCDDMRWAYFQVNGLNSNWSNGYPLTPRYLTLSSTLIQRSPLLGLLKVRGSNDIVLVDHYAIEAEFRDALELLHRWDKPSTTDDSAQMTAADRMVGATLRD